MNDYFSHVCPILAEILYAILRSPEASPEEVGGWFPGKVKKQLSFRKIIDKHRANCEVCIEKGYSQPSKAYQRALPKRKTIEKEMKKRELFSPCNCYQCIEGPTDTYLKEYK